MKYDLKIIAEALRTTKRSAERRANNENWPFTKEAVRGGQRKLFALDDLPKDVARTVKRHVDITTTGAAAGNVIRMIADQKAKAVEAVAAKIRRGEANLKALSEEFAPGVQSRFDGRYAIVKDWEEWYPTVQPMGKKASYWVYAEEFNAGTTKIAAAIREQFMPIKGRSVEHWILKFNKDGLTGLVDHWNGKAHKNVNVFTKNPAIEKTCISLMISNPTISVKHMQAMLNEASVDQGTGEVLFEAPNYDATYRYMKAWKEKNPQLLLASTNPDAWKSKYGAAFGNNAEDVVRLNQRWEMDATPVDWMLQDEDGLRRYSGSGVIDVYSRRTMYLFTPTPKTETHKMLLRMAILQWGIPEEIVTDNGKDYISKEFVNTLTALNIHHHRTDPFSPQQKGCIERMNQSLLHSVLEVYSSFIGHSVAERSAIESRAGFAERLYQKDAKLIEVAMPAQLFQSRVNEWIKGIYEQRGHRGEGMEGMSPFARAAGYQGVIHRIEDARALDVLLAAPEGKGTYKVTKRGLRINGAQFIAMQLGVLIGETVKVKQTEDFGEVVVYHDNKFVCVARCPERTGVSRQEIAIHARQAQKQNIQAQRKAAKATRLDPDAMVSSMLQKKAEAAGKLSVLPTQDKRYTTDALKASGIAAKTLDGAVGNAAIPDDLQAILHKRATASAVEETPESNVTVIPETPQLRFKKWLELDQLLTLGETIDDPTLTRWYGTYAQTSEHAGLMKRHEANASNEERNTGATVLRLDNRNTN